MEKKKENRLDNSSELKKREKGVRSGWMDQEIQDGRVHGKGEIRNGKMPLMTSHTLNLTPSMTLLMGPIRILHNNSLLTGETTVKNNNNLSGTEELGHFYWMT